MYFFFQAEDGIRDTSVTGVQTCALPISNLSAQEVQRQRRLAGERMTNYCPPTETRSNHPLVEETHQRGEIPRVQSRTWERSEERRVGKECRCGCEWEHEREIGEMKSGTI